MSQPGNYQYQMPNPTGSSKSGIPPVVNGQPGAMQFTQNGIQPLSFNSAGTPSSQSSRDPSREASRDPSPTQYLHNQYRPQLTRPPMPPINGQPSPLSRVSLSQASSGSTQSSQSSPQANPQNPGVHHAPVSTTAAFTPPAKSLAVSAQSSSDSPIGIATQKSAPTMARDQSSASESAPGKLAFQSTVDSQSRSSGLPQIGGQHLPPTSLPHSQSQSINSQASWGKGSPIVTNPPPDPTRPTGAWRNPHADPHSNNAPTNFQPPQTTHSQVTAHSWSHSVPPVPHSNNHSPSTLVSNQTWNNPNAEPNSNDSQGTPQSYALHPGAAPPRTQSQQPGGSAPPTSTSAQSLANKPSPVNAANVRDPRIGSQGSPTMTTANASMHSVFGNSPFTQKAATAHQNVPSQPQLSLPKPSQYPTPEHQPNRSVLGGNPVSHSSPYGSQQNVASQWKYPQAGYPGHTPTGSPRVPGPQYGAATNVPGGPGPGGQFRQLPANIGGPLTSGGPTTSFGAPPTSIGAPPTSLGAPPTSIGAPPTSIGAPPTFIGAPPTSIGAPPTSMGAPPTSIGAPPTSIGAPPTSTGAPPSTRAPPTSTGAPPTSMRVAPTSIGAPPTSMGVAPTSMGVAPTSMGVAPTSMGAPPTSIGAPPTSIGASPTFIGVQPTSIRAPPTSIGAPRASIGPPPTSIGAPPRPGQQPDGPYDYRSPQYLGQMSNVPLDNMNKRYPTGPAYPDQTNQLNAQMGNLNVTQSGFNELWGQQSIDLLQCRNILPPEKVEPPRIKLHQEFLDSVNCSPEIFRCTLTKIPESNSLLQKCRLPFGVLIHPFKDLNHLPVIQCSTIVRCRACRTYINPFVYFVDSKRWKCNLCYRVNELPEEFQFDPVTKSYGDPSRRPEVKTSTIEFIAPSEYMLRPPQPAVYLFVLDVSRLAVDSGYLGVVCETIADELTKLPGDGRTQVGFMAIDSAVHFFSMPENVSQPHELIMLDVDDVFLPCPDNLIVNLKEREELVRDLLEQLPQKFHGTYDTNSALGAGLQAAFKLMSPTGGRVTVFQTCLPNLGPGALQPREDPNARASKDVPHLNPATDFYKRLALDYSGQQIAVDLFLLNSQYSDLATLSGMCKFSGGCIYHMPLFRCNKPQHGETLEKMLRRYLARKIGFEAVMRIRCTRGLSIHTFHGNFFVRSTDLLSLPNVNPDAGFGMQVSIEENLSDVQSVCFQAALLYTSSKGERRIRVHTLCLPVSSSMTDILYSADQQAIVGLLSKMAVDRSQQSSLSDARDALINVAIDVFSAYKLSQSSSTGGLMAPGNLKLLPLYIIALVKSVSFRSGTSTRLDDRVYAMCQMKTLPLGQLIQSVYPDLYPVHALDDRNSKDIEGRICPQAPRLHLSAEKLDFRGVFLMDAGDRIYVYVGKSVDPMFCSNVLGVSAYAAIPEELYDLPELDTVESERLRNFVFSLQEEKPYYAPLQIIRDDSHFRTLFTERLIEDRVENALSYYEFLQHLKTQVK